MAKKELTVQQLKDLKKSLDEAIYKLVQDFEKETGVKIDYIDFDRQWRKSPPLRDDYPTITGVTTSFDKSLLE